MKTKLLSISCVLFLICGSVSAQGFLEKLKRKAKETVEEKILNKTGDGIDRGMDKGIDKVGGAVKGGKNGSAAETAESNAKPAEEKQTKGFSMLASFAKYDFVPGEQVIYAADFKEERNGELPQDWNSDGNAMVTTLAGSDANWLRIMQSTKVLSSNTKAFGPDYTIEFDLVMQYTPNGWVLPNLNLGFLATGNYRTTDNILLKSLSNGTNFLQVILHPGVEGRSSVKLESVLGLKDYFHSDYKKFPDLEAMFGTKIHVAIQVQKERFRFWMNGIKVYDIPKAIPVDAKVNQIFFETEGSSYDNESVGIYVSDIKIAKGIPNLRNKLIDEGKFTTNGILFDVNKATIKPESTGVLNEISEVLKQNPTVKVMITGHTDSDGDDKSNQVLSEKRAESVKNILVKNYGINADRLSSNGKGESAPVADNKTKDGKAQNRRVEFIKQ